MLRSFLCCCTRAQIVGVIMFSEPITFKLASFIGLALAGGILYTYIKEKEAQEARKSTLPVTVVPASTGKA